MTRDDGDYIICPSCMGYGTLDDDWKTGEPCPECDGVGEL